MDEDECGAVGGMICWRNPAPVTLCLPQIPHDLTWARSRAITWDAAVRAVKPFLSQESLKMIYFSYFPSIMSCGLIFWGNSYHSNKVFKLEKRIIRIMVGIRDRESCREYFRTLQILPLQSQYIYIYIYILTLTVCD
jgi:hypothetical protein